MEYYSALKQNKLPSHENTWRNLACILLSEISHSLKATYSLIPIPRHSGKGETTESKNFSGFQEFKGRKG